MMSDNEKIMIVVVTYNRKHLLKKSIRSLLAQSRLSDEIIVVDNASTDGTEEMLRDEFPNNPLLQYLNLKCNLGGAEGLVSPRQIATIADKQMDLKLIDSNLMPRVVNICLKKIKTHVSVPNSMDAVAAFVKNHSFRKMNRGDDIG